MYVRRLVHRAAFYRMTITDRSTGTEQSAEDLVGGMSSVPCLLQPMNAQRAMTLFGADLKCDAVVLFKAGTDVRPKLGATGGTNDKLVITEENGTVSTWLVVGSRDPAAARKMTMAAVRRVTG